MNDSVRCSGLPKPHRFVDTICSNAGILKIVVQTGYSVHMKRAIQQEAKSLFAIPFSSLRRENHDSHITPTLFRVMMIIHVSDKAPVVLSL